MSSNFTFSQANQVLDYLNRHYPAERKTSWNWISTRKLLINSDLSGSMDHKNFRSMMLRLYSAGVVEKTGVGTFQWRMKVDKWDREFPTKRLDTAPTPTIKPLHQHNHGLNVTETEKEIILTEKIKDPSDAIRVLSEITTGLNQRLKAAEQAYDKLEKEYEAFRTVTKSQIDSALAAARSAQETSNSRVKTIEIKKPDGKVVKLKNKVLPKVFDRVLALAQCRRNILLVGPAGCGKTHLAKLVAETLDLDFGSISCTAGMSESHLLGRSTPNVTTGESVYNGASFIDCYEGGGVWLFDELDAADPNLLLCINTALANGYVNIPNRRKKPRATKHPDFVCIGTANTFGRGANRIYAGRNQLDEATLDRFRIGIVECDYDLSVEMSICPNIGGQPDRSWHWPAESLNGHVDINRLVNRGYNLRETLQFIRHQISKTGLRRIMSTRFIEDAYIMMSQGDWSIKDVLDAYFEGWSDEEKAKVIV